jgi:hypothetical protein
MFFADTNSLKDLSKVPEKVSLLSKILLPALATLVPAAVTAVVKWVQDSTGKRRSVALTERISTLAKNISDLPEISLSNPAIALTPRAALTAELETAIRELTALQGKEQHRINISLASTTARLRSALLLYRPKGFVAWMLHLSFYTYSVTLVLILIMLMSPSKNDSPVVSFRSPSEFFSSLTIFVMVFGALGVPPMIVRYFAAKIHRKQCAQSRGAMSHGEASAAVCPEPIPAGSGSQMA